MITLYSNDHSFQYLYDKNTGAYLYISITDGYCTEGSCSEEDFWRYRKNCWEDFEKYWTPQELLCFIEEHMVI